jgi:hypothetical protein
MGVDRALLMAVGKDSNKMLTSNFPGAGRNWHGPCFVLLDMSPLGGFLRSGRMALMLIILVLAALAVEAWAIRASLTPFLR